MNVDTTPYRLAVAKLLKTDRLDHFLHAKFLADVDWLGVKALDQRIKFFVPNEQPPQTKVLITENDWYEKWRSSSKLQSDVLRTLTIINPNRNGEFEVLVAAHEPRGRLGEWLETAKPDDEIVVALPNHYSDDELVGIDWRPGTAKEATIIVDDTALPAVLGILDSLQGLQVTLYAAVAEYPKSIAERLAAAGVSSSWFQGDFLERQSNLLAALGASFDSGELEDLIWDSPASTKRDSYYFVAAESGLVRSVRRFLLQHISKSDAAFLGYWKNGIAG